MLTVLDSTLRAALAADTTQADQAAAVVAAFGGGNVTVLNYNAGGTLVMTTVHGTPVADASTPRGWSFGAIVRGSTVWHVSGETIARSVYRNASAVDIYSLDAADLTPSPLVVQTGRHHRRGERSTARSSLPASSLPYSLPTSGAAVAIGTNTSQDVAPSGWSSSSWDYALFGAYGSGTIAAGYSEHGAYVIAGSGGHLAPDNIGATLFDFSTGEWARLDNSNGVAYKATPHYFSFAESNGTPWVEVTGSTVPLPGHPYALAVYVSSRGTLGSIIYTSRAAATEAANSYGSSHRFDLSTLAWSRVAEVGSSRALTESDAVHDAARSRIWHIPNNANAHQTVEYFDLADDTRKYTGSFGFPSDNIEGPGRTVLHDGCLLRNCGSSKGLWYFDPDASSSGWVSLTVSGTLPGGQNRWAPYGGKYYSFSGDSASSVVTRISPPAGAWRSGTWTVDTVTLTGDTLPQRARTDTAHYTRLAYVPAIDCLAWVAGGNADVVIFKP